MKMKTKLSVILFGISSLVTSASAQEPVLKEFIVDNSVNLFVTAPKKAESPKLCATYGTARGEAGRCFDVYELLEYISEVGKVSLIFTDPRDAI